MKNNKTFYLGLLLNIIPFIIGIIFYNQLPNTLAIHFNSNNLADGFTTKPLALFGFPAFLVLVYLFTAWITLNDPRKQNINKKVLTFLLLIIPIMNIIGCSIIISYNLGHSFDTSMLMSILLSFIFIILGNYFPKTKINASFGIKTPWTLNDSNNWDKTHHFAAYLWIIGGIILLISSFIFPQYSTVIILVIAVTISIIPVIYSYYLTKKR